MYTKPFPGFEGDISCKLCLNNRKSVVYILQHQKFVTMPRIWSWNRAMALNHLHLEIGDAQKIKVMLMLKVPGCFVGQFLGVFCVVGFEGGFKFKLMEIESKDCFLGT